MPKTRTTTNERCAYFRRHPLIVAVISDDALDVVTVDKYRDSQTQLKYRQ